jgi:N utilization substance protein A
LEEDVEVDVTPHDFGRLAAQTAKQVIIQRIREIEKEAAYGEFKGKEGDLVVGVIQKHDYKNYLVSLGRIETTLASSEQIPGEILNPKDRVKFYVSEVKKTPRGPVIVISRSHPNLVKKLFELEIPEVAEGIIEIKAIVREPGRRSKVAVYSYDENIAAVGTCIGYMGGRIQNILKELGRERIDIIEYSNDPKIYVANALKPAKISQISLDNENKSARVIVADDQLSLAIGRDGQNVRLASHLTGWDIDIITESNAQKRGLKETPEEPASAEAPRNS